MLLHMTGIQKRYGANPALDGVDLSVAEGELVGLLGPNGAGKSTLVKIATGLVRPNAGEAKLAGMPAGSSGASHKFGYLAELFRYPGWQSARELMDMHRALVDSPGPPEETDELLERVGLADAKDKRIAAMSKGMQQRLGLAQAMIGSPQLLVLDEPTSALDPAGRRLVRVLLVEWREQGRSALVNSHLLSEVELVCDRVVLLQLGKVVAQGTPEDLVAAEGVEVDTGGEWRAFDGVVREQIPALVERLVAEGTPVYGVRMKAGTLEDAYLRILGEGSS
jgi:ABC-2 type transport system ATP-binding protein